MITLMTTPDEPMHPDEHGTRMMILTHNYAHWMMYKDMYYAGARLLVPKLDN